LLPNPIKDSFLRSHPFRIGRTQSPLKTSTMLMFLLFRPSRRIKASFIVYFIILILIYAQTSTRFARINASHLCSTKQACFAPFETLIACFAPFESICNLYATPRTKKPTLFAWAL